MNTPPKKLVIGTAIALLLLMFAAPKILSPDLPDAIKLEINGQPTIGQAGAPIHIVVFEEPKCINCRLFNEKVYPQIKEAYIDTNQATYTAIPVSFLPGSMPAAIALLCVYHSDPLHPNADLYFAYLDYLFEHQLAETVDWATPQRLIDYAADVSPAISTTALEKCVAKQSYQQQIEANTNYGRKVMGGQIGTPTIYINGVEAKQLDFEAIKEMIEELQ